jgi:hypothetical protein
MTETKWTPGPWTAYDFGADWWVANSTDDSGPMLRVGSWHEQREANAHLIAAAPDLYEALCWAIQSWDEHNKHGFNMQGDWVQDARAALSKARGDV